MYSRRLNAKEVLITHKNEEFVVLVADGSTELSGRDYEFRELTLRREQTVRRESFSGESQGEAEESQRTESRDDVDAQKDFWSIQGDFIYRHHIVPRGQLYVPKEETFPVPLKYIDVMRSTHTDLGVAQEKRIDYYWNVDEDRSLSDSWTGFTKFTLLKEPPPEAQNIRSVLHWFTLQCSVKITVLQAAGKKKKDKREMFSDMEVKSGVCDQHGRPMGMRAPQVSSGREDRLKSL